jgi:regulator of sigma E protease
MRYFDEYKRELPALAGQTVTLGIERDSANVVVAREAVVTLDENGSIGVMARSPFVARMREYTLLESIPAGMRRTGEEISGYWKQIKAMVVPESKLYEELGGFLSIGNIFPSEWNWFYFWKITALLSVVLAIMNVLPIPALDGGHALFILVEMLSGRRPSDKVIMVAQAIGMVLLLLLMAYATFNDVLRLF